MYRVSGPSPAAAVRPRGQRPKNDFEGRFLKFGVFVSGLAEYVQGTKWEVIRRRDELISPRYDLDSTHPDVSRTLIAHAPHGARRNPGIACVICSP